MGNPYIVDLDTNKLVNPAELFGKDASRLLAACYKVFQNDLHEYEGCYRSPSRPTLEQVRKTISEGENVFKAYKVAESAWKSINPTEFAKEEESRRGWEEQREKQFRIIYGIARRYGSRLHWHGNDSVCCPDQWTIFRNGKRIARIYCM